MIWGRAGGCSMALQVQTHLKVQNMTYPRHMHTWTSQCHIYSSSLTRHEGACPLGSEGCDAGRHHPSSRLNKVFSEPSKQRAESAAAIWEGWLLQAEQRQTRGRDTSGMVGGLSCESSPEMN